MTKKESQKKWQTSEKGKAAIAKWNKSPKGKAHTRKWNESPEKKAYLRIYKKGPKWKSYLKKNSIAWCAAAKAHPVRQCCSIKGCTTIGERHHPDYAKPIEIIWLCKAHHESIHAS